VKKTSQKVTLESARLVLDAVTPSSRGIFCLLAKALLQNKDGISENELFNIVKDKFFGTQSTQFRSNIREFLDHNIIEIEQTNRGKFYVSLLDADSLTILLDEFDIL